LVRLKLAVYRLGKMYYIRLDCVVTVVDADSLYHSLRDEEELEAAARFVVCIRHAYSTTEAKSLIPM
jgi:hypothetical protein